jgi:DNA-binding response OmpR family regulator
MTPNTQQRRKILVVEDDEPLREILQIVLQTFPHDFLFAEDGAQALKLDLEHTPELILIDLGLPDMPGFRLGELLRQRNGHRQRLIAFTGFNSEDYRAQACEAGFNDFYLKPMGLDEIEQTFTTISGSLNGAATSE